MNELVKEGLLDVNVIFLIEGEEESGSVGFYEAVNQNKELFQNVDMVLLRYTYLYLKKIADLICNHYAAILTGLVKTCLVSRTV